VKWIRSEKKQTRAGKKMVLRVRKRAGMEAEDVLAPSPAAAGGSVWGKLLGGGSRAAALDGAQRLQIPFMIQGQGWW